MVSMCAGSFAWSSAHVWEVQSIPGCCSLRGKDAIRWRPSQVGWRPLLLGTRSYYIVARSYWVGGLLCKVAP